MISYTVMFLQLLIQEEVGGSEKSPLQKATPQTVRSSKRVRATRLKL